MLLEAPIVAVSQPPAPRLRIGDLAADIAAGGVPVSTARNRVADYADRGLIHVRQTGPRTSPNLFNVTDSGVAIALSAVQDAGVGDVDLCRLVATRLYEWSGDSRAYALDGTLPPTPIERALIGIAHDESWSLDLQIFRNVQTGDRRALVYLSRADRRPRMPDDMTLTPRAGTVIVLDDMLLPAARRLDPARWN